MTASEAAVQTAIRVRAAELGIALERNNVGACIDERGRQIRYGLANDSAQKNKRIKSADLIGSLPRRVEFWTSDPGPEATGTLSSRVFGVFLSVECKEEAWLGGEAKTPDPFTKRASFNEREEAQAKWIDHCRAHGRVAFFARSVAEFERRIKEAGFVHA